MWNYDYIILQFYNFLLVMNMLLYMFGMREKVVLQVTIGLMHCWLNTFQESQI